MNSKISDFLAGFSSPTILSMITDAKCLHLEFWIDQLAFILVSILTGILVAIFKDKVVLFFKKK